MSDGKEKKPVLFGCEGTKINPVERALFRNARPFGFILFKRNCEDPEQVRSLIAELRQAADHDDVQFAIDQEGGRVSRLQPPHWPAYPPARTFGLMYEKDPDWGMEAITLYSRIVANELFKLGFTINCAPVVDLFNPEGTAAIGERAISSSPSVVAALARRQIETFLANGILPVVKHLPGHGRLKTDPHKVLPTIEATRAELESQDFMPFELLKDAPIGMNSHAIFTALDPERPASMSLVVNNDIIRGRLGFDGLLFSDDLMMKALNGLPGELAAKALEAGNDIALHCNGKASEMEAIVRVLGPMSQAAESRWAHAKAMVNPPDPAYDPRDDMERLDILLGGLAFDEA
ncbi:MAG: beta-N-acetylhexosaminidase [Alphaproteobacteria bacterium]|nr:beta-N-acetylhexosaminidase [Alphaproteobacteria bacterium]